MAITLDSASDLMRQAADRIRELERNVALAANAAAMYAAQHTIERGECSCAACLNFHRLMGA